MNKGLLIGIGVLAVAGIGGFFWWKSRNKSDGAEDSELQTKSADVGASSGGGSSNAPSDSAATDLEQVESSLAEPASKKEARKQKRQTRRDCRAEAKSKGLKGKAKRQFKRDCKAAGGTNADFVSSEADFAFNGFASFD